MTKDEFGAVIKQIRTDAGFTQIDIAKKTGKAQQTVASWESGQSYPDANTLFLLCEICDTTVDTAFGLDKEVLDHKEKNLIKKYRALNEHGKSNIDVLLENEFKYSEEPEKVIYPMIEYLQPASAGDGEWNDNAYTEELRLIKKPPKGATSIIRVHGNSMEPTFHDGDRLFFRPQQTIEKGEFGVFVISGSVFVKEFDGHSLVPHNKDYDPIPLTEDIICQGKVLGVCDDSYFE